MPKISVIVPVYNVLSCLENCVRSVTAQTRTDWELLLINDGSTDGSAELCRKLAAEDARIRVIERENGGVASARNAGIDAAAGEYITFLDGDDTYLPDHLERLLATAQETGADVTATNAFAVSDDGVFLGEYRQPGGVFTGTETILRQFLRASGGLYVCWNKLFRADAVGDIRFKPYMRAEDVLFCVEVLSNAKIYAVSEYASYRYYRRAGSVTMHSPVRGLRDQLTAWTEVYALAEKYAPSECPFVASKLCHDADNTCRGLLTAGKTERKLVTSIRQKYDPLRFSGKIPAKKRLASALYRLSPELYYALAEK